jgi:protocatechuate 3,4-dioxygenase beta subunit
VAADNGPFYPAEPIAMANDLFIRGPAHPPGVPLFFLGRVVDEACAPVRGATVEIWQCDAGGQYRHPKAPKLKPLERRFRYFAKAATDAGGRFWFRTLRPVPYTVGGTARAPHIHVKIKVPGRRDSTTEVYFHGVDDERRQSGDAVFQMRGPRRGEMLATLRPAVELGDRLPMPVGADALAFTQEFSVSRPSVE